MALSLLKYAEMLDGRNDPHPMGPEPTPFESAKPHLPPMRVRAVVWSGFGTLILSAVGEPELVPSDAVMKKIALDKTIAEFRMWASMTRKPGEPSDQMAGILQGIAERITAANMTGYRTEIRFEEVWQGVVERLLQKEYKYDGGLYGELQDYAAKIAYYYQRACQGVSAYPRALATLKAVAKRGLLQGAHANGQSATPILLHRELATQGSIAALGEVFDPALCFWSGEMGVRKESDLGFQLLVKALASKGLKPADVLYVGNDVERDVAPAKRRGFQTALLLADRPTAKVKAEQLKDEKTKPNALMTAFEQVVKLLPSEA